jgi:Uma2 family endonuclease
VLASDLWRRASLDTGYLTLAPDWLCEVVSPSTEMIDRKKKLAVYARECVGHVWLVDPLLETLEVLRLESMRWSLLAKHGGRASVRAEPFDAIELELGALWPNP